MPRARTVFLSASTKRLAAGMPPTVSDYATSQAPVAPPHGLLQDQIEEEKAMIATRPIPLSALELSAAMRAAQPYDASRLDRILRIDERQGLIEVQAATPWKTIA